MGGVERVIARHEVTEELEMSEGLDNSIVSIDFILHQWGSLKDVYKHTRCRGRNCYYSQGVRYILDICINFGLRQNPCQELNPS